MAVRDQLEVISPSGDIQFFELDESDGLTNVGRHPSNNVVLAGPGIADFHLVVDHRRHPYQVGVLGPNAEVIVEGQRLGPNEYRPLQPWDSIEVAGYTILLVAQAALGEPAAAAAPVSVLPGPVGPAVGPAVGTAVASISPVAPTPPAGGAPAPGGVGAGMVGPQPAAAAPLPLTAPPTGAVEGNGSHVIQPLQAGLQDLVDEIIVVDISEREVSVGVEQPAMWQITIANGGALVARFDVHIEGAVDASWVSVSPVSQNLYEGGRGAAIITVTPPRAPTSRAGAHSLAVVVTSPNYPGHVARRIVTLRIQPYYEYQLGEVSPRQQTVSYFRKSGTLKLPIHNRGNSETTFRVDAVDDENTVTFEMESPTDGTRLVRTMEVHLAPDQKVTVPIAATPRNFRIVGAGTQMHSVTLTTTMTDVGETPRSVLAQLRNRPIVGPWFIMLLGVIAAAIVLITFRPQVDRFAFAPGTVKSFSLDTEVATAESGQTMAAGVTQLQGKTLFGIKIPKLPKLPKQLSFLTGMLPGTEGEGEPEAGPAVTTAMVDAGNEVTLVWDVRRAESVTIEKLVGGNRQFVATIEDPGRQRQFSFVADRTRENAGYQLTATNWIARLPFVGATLGFDEAVLALITDPVKPEIEVFSVDPNTMVTGKIVNLAWQVARAQEVELRVNGVPRPLTEVRGTLEEQPATTTEYQLVARSPYWEAEVVSDPLLVVVSLPTPVIRTFDVGPRPIIDGQPVRVSWEVEGADSVLIDPLPGPAPNLQGQDEGVLEPGKSQQTFTLRALFGEGDAQVEARTTRVVEIVPPTSTATATYTPTPTPTATSTPIPTPLVKVFDVEPKPIVDGQLVRVIWAVEGASSVEISPVLGVVPNLEGQNEFQIEQGKTLETFTLRAIAADPVTTVEVRTTRVVQVVTQTPTATPTPTPTPTVTPQLPVIQVFELVPKEVVRGNAVTTATDGEGQAVDQSTQPKLTWTVVGEATNVEVSGPDFGPVRNLPKEGTLRVPANESTVYQLNVYYNDVLIVSQTQELTVLEPTPTPSPPPPPPPPTATPTATPAPGILSFAVNAAAENGQVAPVASDDDVPTYEVEAGTSIRLAWRVENAVTEVRLTDTQNDYGVRSPEDEFITAVTQSTVYRLSVLGTGDAPLRYERRIRMNVLPIQPPPPPFNVNGNEGPTPDDPGTVTWNYPGEFQSRILGFRIYRADVDNFNFSRVANEFELDNTANQWPDPTTPTCDRVYYVVAVYEDITRSGDDRIQETQVSPSSWYTLPCP